MIAPVAISGILIMAVLANQAYSSSLSSRSVKCKTTQAGVTTCKTKTKTKTTTPLPQVSKIVKTPQVRTTLKTPQVRTTLKTPQVRTTQTPTAVSNNVTRSPSGQPTGGNVAQGTQKSSITGNVTQGASNIEQGSPAKKQTELTISATQKGSVYTEYGNTLVPLTISGRLTSGGSGVAGATIALNSEEEIGDVKTDSAGYYHYPVSLFAKIKHEISAWTREVPSEYNESSVVSTTFRAK